jgi:hypothetical protein
MKLLFSILVPVLFAASCQTSSSNPPPPHEAAAATPEHQWLQQLVGTWKVDAEMSMGPDQPPMKMESTEKVRSLGGLWVLAEGSANMDGTRFSSVMTVGYDPAKQHFVGSWVDTMQTHLWIYRGSLDESRTTLTLEAEGPRFDDPNTLTTYRDAVELVDANHKRLTSSVKNADGSWTQFMQANYERVK